MSFITGLLEGFQERKTGVEAENRRSAELAAQREAAVFNTLAQSDDPEIQALAVAGLLESAQPRKKKGGIRGWLGEMEGSQTYAKMRELIASPITTTQTTVPTRTANLPSQAQAPIQPAVITPQDARTPTGQPSAAMPTTNAVEPGAGPPPQPLTYTQGPPTQSYTTSTPRQIFLTPEARMLANARTEAQKPQMIWEATYRAQRPVRGEEEARRLADQAAGYTPRAGTAASVKEGNVRQLPDGSWVQDLYNASGQVVNSIPARDPTLARSTSLNYGMHFEKAAKIKGYNSGASVPPGAEAQEVEALAARLAADTAGGTTAARAEAMADAPLSTSQTFTATTELQEQWRKASEVPHQLQASLQKMRGALAQAKAGNMAPGGEAIQVTFQKALDPTSVVLPTEFARSFSTQPLGSRFFGMLERLKQGGTGIPLAELDGYVAVAEEVARSYDTYLQIKRQQIHRTATDPRFNLNPDQIFGPDPLGLPPSTTTPPPAGRTTAPPAAAPPARATPTPSAGPAGAVMKGGRLYINGQPID